MDRTGSGKRSRPASRHEQASQPAGSAERAGAPGKRTPARALPGQPAGARLPVQYKADPADGAARSARAALTQQWIDTATRPDLYPPPVQRPVQRKPAGDAAVGEAGSIETSGRGRPMPEDVQAKMEHAFGADFSPVRVHEGPQAASVGALAYTQGTDVHFAPGQYNPGSQRGQELLGHELTHVVQQSQGRVRAPAQAKGVGVNDDAGLEREADLMGARAARGQAVAALATARRSPTSARAPIQRFGSLEHQSLGDNASGGAEYDLGGHNGTVDASAYNQAFRLTHGDIVMLSGDFFSPRDTRMNDDGVEEPDPDSLFLLAGTPSTDPGQDVGTWDEVVYAIKKAIPSDPRFHPSCTTEYPEGHPWSRVAFSADVVAAVDARYLRRAAANQEHFVAPDGTDEGPGAGDGRSAGGSYRAQHEAAVLMAYEEGSPANAGAREAAAQHFLTDHFAAGHLRTPRGSIRAHWSAIYPLFWDNIRNKIALDVATWINDNDAIGNVATVDQIYTDVQGTVAAETADIPPMGFDDLVSLVAHDYDNANGLWVVNDLGIAWLMFGDGNLDSEDSQNRTREMSEAAVSLGLADIEAAASLGASKGDTPMSTEEALAAVRAATAGLASPHASKYGPEQVLPRLDPARAAENGTQNWEQPNIDALWEAPVHSSTQETFGSEITISMRDGELKDELSHMADKFPESQDTMGVFTVHPRRAFLEGFLAPLSTNARAGLLAIINFSPSTGQAGFNQDDAVMREINGEDGEGGMTEEQLAGLTLEQKAERIRALVSGTWSWCGEDEGETVIRLFAATGSGQRQSLYELVEGHAWEGDFRNGLFTTDDVLWDSLSYSQLDRLRTLIGG